MAQVKCAFCQHCVTASRSRIATISLFAALGYWNDWFNALLYIQKDTLVPLQYLLMKIQNNLEFLSRSTDMGAKHKKA